MGDATGLEGGRGFSGFRIRCCGPRFGVLIFWSLMEGFGLCSAASRQEGPGVERA